MTAGEFAGKPVAEAKVLTTKLMVESGQGAYYYEPE
jgi:hypothetical protein